MQPCANSFSAPAASLALSRSISSIIGIIIFIPMGAGT